MSYNKNKTHIKVLITKTCKFRALVSPPDAPMYGVTVGGEQWAKGKGQEHIGRIKIGMDRILNYLKTQRDDINAKVEEV